MTYCVFVSRTQEQHTGNACKPCSRVPAETDMPQTAHRAPASLGAPEFCIDCGPRMLTTNIDYSCTGTRCSAARASSCASVGCPLRTLLRERRAPSAARPSGAFCGLLGGFLLPLLERRLRRLIRHGNPGKCRLQLVAGTRPHQTPGCKTQRSRPLPAQSSRASRPRQPSNAAEVPRCPHC